MKKEKKYVIDNPTLMDEWDWDKNNELGIFPDKLTCGSSKSVWWKCLKCGNEWKTKISHRTNGTGCKKCLHKKLSQPNKDNNLLFLAPELCEEWNYNKNVDLPSDYCVNSNKKVWWICSKCGYEWQASVSHRYNRKQGCPFCINRKVVYGKNDLFSIKPEIEKEWNYEKNNLLDLDPKKISIGSHKKVWWKCSICGHEWQSLVYTRTKNSPQGCPKCAKEKQTSFQEKAIAFYLSKIFNIDENKKFKWLGNSELDIYIDELKLAIEYDGKIWHENISKDLKKDNLCEKNEISLIRIREVGCPIYESSSIKIFIKPNKNKYTYLNALIKEIFNIINKTKKLHFKLNIDVDRDFYKILEHYYCLIKDKSILDSTFFDEWNYEKNQGVEPKYVSVYSNKKFWWKCKNGHVWKQSPAHRSKGRNCPYCSNQKVLVGFNDLLSCFPDIAKEWDYEKNNVLPNEVVSKTNKKYWWKCSKCGHSWKTSVYVRTAMGCGCPNCKKIKISAFNSKKVINLDTKEIFVNAKKAGESCGVCTSAISNCCRGVSKTAGGFHWEFVNDK